MRGLLAGFSQAEVARLLKVPRTTVQAWAYEDFLFDGTSHSKYPVPPHKCYEIVSMPKKSKCRGVCKICFRVKEYVVNYDKNPKGKPAASGSKKGMVYKKKIKAISK